MKFKIKSWLFVMKVKHSFVFRQRTGLKNLNKLQIQDTMNFSNICLFSGEG